MDAAHLAVWTEGFNSSWETSSSPSSSSSSSLSSSSSSSSSPSSYVFNLTWFYSGKLPCERRGDCANVRISGGMMANSETSAAFDNDMNAVRSSVCITVQMFQMHCFQRNLEEALRYFIVYFFLKIYIIWFDAGFNLHSVGLTVIVMRPHS